MILKILIWLYVMGFLVPIEWLITIVVVIAVVLAVIHKGFDPGAADV